MLRANDDDEFLRCVVFSSSLFFPPPSGKGTRSALRYGAGKVRRARRHGQPRTPAYAAAAGKARARHAASVRAPMMTLTDH